MRRRDFFINAICAAASLAATRAAVPVLDGAPAAAIPLKVFQLDEYSYYFGTTVQEALRAAQRDTGFTDKEMVEYYPDPVELTDDDLNECLIYESEDGMRTGEKPRTMAQQIDLMRWRGDRRYSPGFFCGTQD